MSLARPLNCLFGRLCCYYCIDFYWLFSVFLLACFTLLAASCVIIDNTNVLHHCYILIDQFLCLELSCIVNMWHVCMYMCVFSYEKLISGMYMGEIARRVIVECVTHGGLFGGKLSDELNTPHRFYTKYVSEIEKYYSFQFIFSCKAFLSID